MEAVLNYEVTKVDPRLNLVAMNISSMQMTGTITAFLRPPPREQPCFDEMRKCVSAGEFTGQRALVIGGSRGLGEVVAKLLCAGGADVKITYYRGMDDAGRVVDEITAGGGSVSAIQLDVLDEAARMPDVIGDDWTPTHLYYFATPFIAAGTRGEFSDATFQSFCSYYVDGFERIVLQLHELGLKAVLYPSSVYVDEPPVNMAEYAAAKAAGEDLCGVLEESLQGLSISRPRLSRMATDQTASLAPTRNEDPVPVILACLRAM
jgi:hypothetical protein